MNRVLLWADDAIPDNVISSLLEGHEQLWGKQESADNARHLLRNSMMYLSAISKDFADPRSDTMDHAVMFIAQAGSMSKCHLFGDNDRYRRTESFLMESLGIDRRDQIFFSEQLSHSVLNEGSQAKLAFTLVKSYQRMEVARDIELSHRNFKISIPGKIFKYEGKFFHGTPIHGIDTLRPGQHNVISMAFSDDVAKDYIFRVHKNKTGEIHEFSHAMGFRALSIDEDADVIAVSNKLGWTTVAIPRRPTTDLDYHMHHNAFCYGDHDILSDARRRGFDGLLVCDNSFGDNLHPTLQVFEHALAAKFTKIGVTSVER